MLTQEMQRDLVDGLCEIFGDQLSSIVLYGSVARGQETDQSDIDIAVVLKETVNSDKRDGFLALAAQMDLKYDRVFSIIDIDQENMSKWGEILPFYKNVQKEGIILWKAA